MMTNVNDFISTCIHCFLHTHVIKKKSIFQVPFMPLLPVMSVFCNQLMLVSIIDKGSLIASIILAAVGMLYFIHCSAELQNPFGTGWASG